MAKRPQPGSAPNYQELRKGRFSWDTDGLMEGGGPAPTRAVIGQRDLMRMAGNEATPRGRALEARAGNVEGHEAMTRKTEREIRLRKMEAAAKAPGASQYAKDRFRRAKETGMYAKGGTVGAAEAVHKHERNMHKGKPLTKMAKGGSASKRADGCATKGKTKGKII